MPRILLRGCQSVCDCLVDVWIRVILAIHGLLAIHALLVIRGRALWETLDGHVLAEQGKGCPHDWLLDLNAIYGHLHGAESGCHEIVDLAVMTC